LAFSWFFRYAKNERTWRSNNRITRVRFGACGPDGPSKTTDLKDTRTVDGSAVTLPLEPPVVDAVVEAGCARLQVEAVDPGPAGDTCISEFKPILICN
jgi:hypothetical protein